MDLIKAAINYACRDEHDGAGFTLLIRDTTDLPTEVAYQRDGDGYVLTVWPTRYDGYEQPNAEQPIFFHPDKVVSVTVLW